MIDPRLYWENYTENSAKLKLNGKKIKVKYNKKVSYRKQIARQHVRSTQ